MAYPLPYGEYLGEVEALHLILAHDLYTELRQIISHVQVSLLVTCEISIFSVFNVFKNIGIASTRCILIVVPGS